MNTPRPNPSPRYTPRAAALALVALAASCGGSAPAQQSGAASPSGAGGATCNATAPASAIADPFDTAVILWNDIDGDTFDDAPLVAPTGSGWGVYLGFNGGISGYSNVQPLGPGFDGWDGINFGNVQVNNDTTLTLMVEETSFGATLLAANFWVPQTGSYAEAYFALQGCDLVPVAEVSGTWPAGGVLADCVGAGGLVLTTSGDPDGDGTYAVNQGTQSLLKWDAATQTFTQGPTLPYDENLCAF